jgi:hypothetical protein
MWLGRNGCAFSEIFCNTPEIIRLHGPIISGMLALANAGMRDEMAKRIGWMTGVALAAMGAAGIAAAQPPTLGYRDPSDPLQPVPPSTYRPVTSGLQSFRPVEPLPWGSQNQKVAPQPKAGGGSPASGQ